MADFELGINAKTYQGTSVSPASGIAVASLAEMSNIRDLTLSLEAGETDVTTRANSGWEATAATLKKASVEFEMVYKPADVGFTAIQAAFLASGTIALAVLTGAHTVPGNEGLVGNFSVTNFSRKEGLKEAQIYNVTCKLAEFGEWHVAT